jgi:hypothetical protein
VPYILDMKTLTRLIDIPLVEPREIELFERGLIGRPAG